MGCGRCVLSLVVTLESELGVHFVHCFRQAFVGMATWWQSLCSVLGVPQVLASCWWKWGCLCPKDLQPDSHFLKTGFGYLGSVKIALVSQPQGIWDSVTAEYLVLHCCMVSSGPAGAFRKDLSCLLALEVTAELSAAGASVGSL